MTRGERLAGGLIRHRTVFLAAVLLLTVFFAWQATRLTFSTSPETILESGYEDLAGLRAHERHFGGFERVVVSVFEVEDVFAPEVRDRVLRATESLESLPVVFAVRTVFKSGLPLPDPSTEPEAFRRAALENPLVSPFLVSPDARFGAVQITLTPGADGSSRREESLRQVEAALCEAGLDSMTGGVPAIRRAYATHIREDVFFLPPIVAGLLLLVLVVAFRRLPLALAPMIVVAFATVWTVGILSLSGGRVSALTSILPSLILVVGIATGVHVVSRFGEERERGAEPKAAATIAMRAMALPCGLTALTTAVGFCSLLVARIHDVREFGLYSAVGALLSFALGVPLVAVLLSFLRGRAGARTARTSPFDRPLRRLGASLVRRPGRAVMIGVLLAAVSLAGVLHLESETFILEDVGADDPVRRAGVAIDRHLGGMLTFDLVVESADRLLDPATVRWCLTLEEKLRGIPNVRAVLGPGTLLDQASRVAGVPSLGVERASRMLELISLAGGAEAVSAFVSPDRRMARISVRFEDVGSRRGHEIRDRALESAQAEKPPGVEVRVAGLAVLADLLLGRLVIEMAKSMAIAFVVIFLLMSVLFRSLKIGALSMVPNFLPLLAAGGFMGVTGITVRSSIALIFAVALGIAVDDTIHVLTRFLRERKAGRTRRGAVLRAVRWTGRPVTLTSILLFLGFLVFVSSDFKATEQFGLISAVTIASAFLGDMVLLPGLLLLKRRRK